MQRSHEQIQGSRLGLSYPFLARERTTDARGFVLSDVFDRVDQLLTLAILTAVGD
jgi:hypothetical protein